MLQLTAVAVVADGWSRWGSTRCFSSYVGLCLRLTAPAPTGG